MMKRKLKKILVTRGDMDKIFFDIEADNLLYDATTIWCIVAKIVEHYHIYLHEYSVHFLFPTNATVYCDINQYLSLLKQGQMVGHNIISYDLPLLEKLHGFKYSLDQKAITDTHILSRLYNPDRLGHSLAHFGEKFSFPKGNFHDFSALSQDMINYCIRDVDLLEKVYNYLEVEGTDWDWSEAIKLEYNIWHVQMKQEQHGVLFDVPAAEVLVDKIVQEIKEIEDKVTPLIPPVVKDGGELKKIFLKSGEYTAPVKLWINE